jgi:predicted nucleotidyltransferase
MRAMTLQGDFREFLRLLVDHEVEFMVVGGHAVSHHGYPRFTHDVDVVVDPSRENAERLIAALDDFGFGALDLTAAEFTRDTTVVLGRAPHEIDIMTFVKGVELKSAWDRRSYGSLDGVSVPFIGKDDLIANKRAVGRPEDLADVARLTRVP